MITCTRLMDSLGYSCRPVTLIGGEGQGLGVTTPFAFPDGDPISFYLINHDGGNYALSDNADTLMHLMNAGFNLENRKRWRPFVEMAAQHGLTIRPTGEVRAEFPHEHLRDAITRFIAFALEVGNWQRDNFGMAENTHHLVQEVENYLRRWKPHAQVQRSIDVTGASKKHHHFDFLFGNQLIDAIRPNSNKTGAELRKIVDVNNGPNSIQTMVIIDDREHPDRAKDEMMILSAVTKVMPLSRLERNALQTIH